VAVSGLPRAWCALRSLRSLRQMISASRATRGGGQAIGSNETVHAAKHATCWPGTLQRAWPIPASRCAPQDRSAQTVDSRVARRPMALVSGGVDLLGDL